MKVFLEYLKKTAMLQIKRVTFSSRVNIGLNYAVKIFLNIFLKIEKVSCQKKLPNYSRTWLSKESNAGFLNRSL